MSLFLNESVVGQLLTMDLALDAVEESHRELSFGKAIDIPASKAVRFTPGKTLKDAVK